MSQAAPAVAPGPTRRFRLASPGTALVVAALVLALMVAEFPLASLAHQSVNAGGGGIPIWISAPFGVIGFLVAYRAPGNRLGWIFLGLAASSTVAEDASFYVVACYRLRHGGLPFGWVALLAQPNWSITIVLIGLAFLLFPDGHLPSPRLRWVLWTFLAVGAVWMVSAFSFTVSAVTRHDIHVDPSGNLQVLDHPTGSAAWWGVVQNAVLLALAVCGLVSLAGQAVSYRRSSGERRQQLKWLMGGSAAVLAGLFLTAALSSRPGVAGVLGQLAGWSPSSRCR